MTVALETRPLSRATSVADLGLLSVAGFASLGAGAVHAAAIGTHAEHRAAVLTFTALAAVQLGWGAVALARSGRKLALLGLAVNGIALAGWVVAKTSGIGFIAGLDHSEPIQRADGIAAALAAVAVVVALRTLVLSYLGRPRSLAPKLAALVGIVALGVASTGMVAAGEHRHQGDEHAHGQGTEAVTSAVPAKPYDPDLPIDLGGVDGVTPQEQARAENLVAITLARLPKFSDPATAEAEGFRSINDGFLGHEHYINASYANDPEILNPDRPESLVYDTSVTPKKLVSAMFMLPPGTTLDDVPELGGALTQWHIHDNLCFAASGSVAGLVQADGSCQAPLVKGAAVPMIHVWITPHVCGPFAALEGLAAGSVKPGETRLCDHAHGASS